eukprot:2750888-Prymnesium_polylepis.1
MICTPHLASPTRNNAGFTAREGPPPRCGRDPSRMACGTFDHAIDSRIVSRHGQGPPAAFQHASHWQGQPAVPQASASGTAGGEISARPSGGKDSAASDPSSCCGRCADSSSHRTN